MKRLVTLLLCLCMFFPIFAGCELIVVPKDGVDVKDGEWSGGGNSKGSDGFTYGKNFMDQNLRGDYSITYELTSSDSDERYVTTFAQTSKGRYISYGDGDVLYIMNSDNKYEMYSRNWEGIFEKDEYTNAMTEEELEENFMYIAATAMIKGYMMQYSDNIAGLKKSGSAKVAGRDCDKYTFGLSLFGVSMKYEYYIDKATGVCLKWYWDAAAGGQSEGYSFECIEFKTSGVTLPNYR